MAQRGVFRRPERERNHGRQAGQRNDIHHVVVKDRDQLEGLVRAQILEVVIGDHLPGQVAFPLQAQDLVLQVHQPAAIEPQLPQPPRAVQQIEVRHAGEGRPRASHPVAGFEQRLIV